MGKDCIELMPNLDDKPGLAIMIAQKKRPSEDDDKESDGKAVGEMGSEILSNMKDGDGEAFGKSLMNFIKFALSDRE